MFQLNNIRHTYSADLTIAFPDWQASQGEHWLLAGASGSGKTTLLHILAGLRRPSAGSVTVAGSNLYELGGSRADQFRGQHIGLVLQKPHLLPTLNVEENLRLAQYMAGLPQDGRRIAEVLETLGMAAKHRAMPQQLSQGQAQRVSIARAVLNRPQLLLADEPTASLDDENAFGVLQLIEGQAQICNATLVIATHDARVKNRMPKQYKLDGTKRPLASV